MKKICIMVLIAISIFSCCACNGLEKNDSISTDVATEDNLFSEINTMMTVEPVARVIYCSSFVELDDSDVIVKNDPSENGLGTHSKMKEVDGQKENKAFTMSDGQLMLTYECSQEYVKQDVPEMIQKNRCVDLFYDNDGNQYHFYLGTDVLNYYHNVEANREFYVDSGKAKTKDELSQLADKVIETFAGIDVMNFEKGTVNKRDNQYYVTYRYKFCGYDTDTYISMSFTPSGTLAFYHSNEASIFQTWEGKITEADIKKAAATVSRSSIQPSGSTEQKLVMGDDGYMYLMMDSMTAGYTETDENGGYVRDVLPTESVCYVRVIPES
ncbi:MAG: hypothetical protein E7645_02640 [Ruminococcaceae bacterium]|nr:hypothetical protein [Oscillospiraceae bacterium]